jgi:hypothetical protein
MQNNVEDGSPFGQSLTEDLDRFKEAGQHETIPFQP